MSKEVPEGMPCYFSGFSFPERGDVLPKTAISGDAIGHQNATPSVIFPLQAAQAVQIICRRSANNYPTRRRN
jgi:hypothetical protein